MPREFLAVIRAVAGLAQGGVLYLLYAAAESRVWPATQAPAFVPLVLAAFFVPILGVAGVGNIRLRTLAIWLTVAAVVVAALGFP